jgi:hypothetical protein
MPFQTVKSKLPGDTLKQPINPGKQPWTTKSFLEFAKNKAFKINGLSS